MQPNSKLRNCPIEFYENCRNAIVRCSVCSAGSGGKTLRYFPESDIKELELKNHPASIEAALNKRAEEQEVRRQKLSIDKEKSKQVKQGRAQEKKSADRINKIISQTVNSGATFGDGDLKALQGLVQIDSKLRHTKRSFTVSWAEYESGRKQGTNHWLITVKDKDDKPHSLVCMTEEIYSQLLALAAEALEHRGSNGD